MRLRLAVALLVLAAPAAALAAPSAEIERGLHLYGRYCIACHGPNGSGQVRSTETRVGGGPARDQTVQAAVAPPLRGVGALAADFYLSTGYMPLKRIGVQPRRSRLLLGPREIDALVAYVASLGKGPPVPTPHPERGDLSEGQLLFTRNCAGCHQVVAEGGFVTGAVPPPLGQATPTQIAEAVRVGPYVMPTFSTRRLSDRQLDSIIRYVEWAKHPDDRGGWALGHIGPVPEGLVTWFLAASVLVAVCMLLGRRLGG
jgi:ubiquinol-cytochrome c reductase cytochrome c subunit